MADPLPLWEVTTLDRETGQEDKLRLNARNPADARAQVNALGLAAGDVRLISAVAAPEPAPGAGKPSTKSPADIPGSPGRPLAGSKPREFRGPPPPGAVHCPRCNDWQWFSGRGLFIWILIILFLPISLLLLFIQPTHTCATCAYTYRAYKTPPGAKRRDQFALLIMAIWIFTVIGIILARNWSTITGG